MKPPRRFHSFEDIESGLCAVLSVALSEFEHLSSTILLQISQVSNYTDRGELLLRLKDGTNRYLEIATADDGSSFGCGQIARQHCKVLDRLAKHYEDSFEDAYEAENLRLDVLKLRHQYGISAEGSKFCEVAIFQSISERTSKAFGTMKPKVHDRHFARLFANVDRGFPAAHTALCYKRPEAAKVMVNLSAGAWSEKDILGRQISHLAAESGNLDLVGGSSTEARDIYRMTPLAVAAQAGNLRLFKHLADHGHSLDSRDIEGRSVLCIAAGAGNLEIVRYLLQRNVNPNPYNLGGGQFFTPKYTALHAAAAGGHVEVTKLLLEHKAMTGWLSNDITPLQEATEHGHQKIIQLLKEAEGTEAIHIKEAERSNQLGPVPDITQHSALSAQLASTGVPMQRSQTQLPLSSMGSRFTPPPAWSRKRTHAQSDAASTPTDRSQ